MPELVTITTFHPCNLETYIKNIIEIQTFEL